jgi:hypothetical protein
MNEFPRERVIRISSFLLTGAALLLVLVEHLLVPFLAGCWSTSSC